MSFTKLFAEIWRDFVTEGVPGSGAHAPVKADIRQWGAEAEAELAALGSPAEASTTELGVVEHATAGEVRAATAGNLVVTPGAIEGASAAVALADAATVDLDWDTGINFTLQITEARTLGNPTNGQPGTWRTVYLTSDAGPDALSFGNQYFGPAVDTPPEPEASVTEYVLAILCVTASKFVVTAIAVDVS